MRRHLFQFERLESRQLLSATLSGPTASGPTASRQMRDGADPLAIALVGPSPLAQPTLDRAVPTYVSADTSVAAALPAVAGVSWMGINHDGVGRVGICTGSLLWTGRHVLTAAHCVNPNLAGSVSFELANGTLAYAYGVGDAQPHPNFTGFASGFDVAVITLPIEVDVAVPRYEIFRPMDGSELGALTVKFGYGRSGNGNTGSTGSWSGKRRGVNQWEATGLGSLGVNGLTNNETQLTYDFDSGSPAHDAFGYFYGTTGPNQTTGDPAFNDLGLGINEVMSAGGDSGSPSFVDHEGVYKIAGVASYIFRLDDLGGGNSDSDGVVNSSFGEFAVDARVAMTQAFIDAQLAATVVARHVFYNNSAFDDELQGHDDDDAIAPDLISSPAFGKTALLAGQASRANYTNYAAGINGIMVDIRDLWKPLTNADFEFRTGATGPLVGWVSLASSTATVSVRSVGNGVDRVSIVWPDHLIQNTWLEIRIKANDNSGLPADDLFYYGNLIGETGNSVANANLDFADLQATLATASLSASLETVTDINRDGVVDIQDAQATSEHLFSSLELISIPAISSALPRDRIDTVFAEPFLATDHTADVFARRELVASDLMASDLMAAELPSSIVRKGRPTAAAFVA